MVVTTLSPNSKTTLISTFSPFYNAKHQHLQIPQHFILIPLLTFTMFGSFWRSIDRFSIQHFKYVIRELQKIKVVNERNREFVVDSLQCIVEIVTYGDRQDPLIFECFMEHQVLAEFVRILKTSENSKIEAPLLQYLSIMIQNMDNEQAIYYCFSNGYINSIISHPYKFDGGDLASYYVSFLRAISGKINRDTLCLLVKVHGDAVVSFPLYTEALRFAHHEEKMIQTAIRSLVLNIYNVSDDMVYQFILTPPVSEYFSDLVHRLRDLCFRLDSILYDKGAMETQTRRNRLILQYDKIVDELYYFKDILSVGKPRLTRLVTENLLNGLVFPILFSLLASKNNDESGCLSAVTSLYIVSHLLQVVGGRSMINNVACVILYHFSNLNVSEGNATDDHDVVKPFAKCLSEIERTICYAPELNGAESLNGNYLGAHWEDFMSGFSTDEICSKRRGILELVISEDCSLLLASIFLLLILAESEDLDCFLSPMIGLYRTGDVMLQTNGSSTSKSADGSIFIRFMPEILNAVLKVLAFQQSLSTVMLWHVGWCLRKLLNFNREGLDSDNLLLFTTSYDQSHAHFLKELDGIWFDHIPDALRTEWKSCIRALEQSSQYKDPLFVLELVLDQQSTNAGETSSYFAWQRMDDAMKAFILHFQLKTFIFKSVLVEKPLLNTIASFTNDPAANRNLDVSSVSFGSTVSLECGMPCRIAFSNSENRDVYVIPVAYGMSGKLLLAEKHPFRSRHGVVIAIAPLAGLCPKIDEDHPSWLLLRIRNFDPQFYTIKARDKNRSMTDHLADGRWILGFPNAKACEEAQFAILNEVAKQRSAVEFILAPLLQNDLGLAVDKGS